MVARQALGPLHGRAAAAATLAEAVEQAADGRLSAVLIEGEPGIGKSCLIDRTLDLARAARMRTFHGESDEFERTRPFGPLLQAFGIGGDTGDERRSLVAALVNGSAADRVLPAVEPTVQFQVAEALLDLVEATAIEAPVAVAVDDLHWADAGTLLVLRNMCRRLADLPLLLVGAYRSWPQGPELLTAIAAVTDVGGRHIPLGPLDGEAVAALAREELGDEPGPLLLEMLEGTAGNPFYATELLRALREDGAITTAAGVAELKAPDVPPSLRVTVLRRLHALPTHALGILRTASLLGTTFSLEDVGTVMNASPLELYRALEEALRLGIITSRGGALGFRHDLVRETLYGDIEQGARAALHHEAARTLAAAGASPLRVAEQYAAGAAPGDDEAIVWLRRAARNSALRSTSVAIDLLERARSLADSNSPVYLEIVAELAVFMVVAGRAPQAESLLEAPSAPQTSSATAGALGIGLAEALWNRGDHSAALDQFAAIAALGEDAEPFRSIAAAFEAQLSFLTADLERARRTVEQALAAAAPSVHTEVEAITHETLALIAVADGRMHEAVTHGARAQQLTETITSEWAPYLYPGIYHGLALLEADELQQARSVLGAGRQRTEALGNVSWLPMHQWLLTGVEFISGEWADAAAEAETGLRLADEYGNVAGLVFPHAMLAHIALHRGELEEADARLARAQRTLESTGSLLGTDWLAWGRGVLSEARGDVDDALRWLEGAWTMSRLLPHFLVYRSLGPDVVRVALAGGRRDLAEDVTTAVEAGVRRAPLPSTEAAGLCCRGLLEGDAEMLLAAVEAARQSPRALDAGLACEAAARILGGHDRDAAVGLLDEALTRYRDLGARYDAGRILASLRALGVRRGVSGTRRRPSTGWAALTNTEELVARLAAQRLTNAEIGQQLYISKRTVQTHLQHIFGKLGISSRRDLARHVPEP